ncbi:MAG TPA: glycosyltransferase family 1 protein [Gemmatimonadales bacterium]|nr:glycosyltransferase family 1 protein [Gemmatimonadales bacterium]
MRIALTSDTYTPQVNGVTTVVHRIAQVLRAAGHAVAVVAPRYPRGSDDGGGGGRDDELRVFSLPFPPYPSIRLSFPLDRQVARFLDRFAPDLVHAATEGPIGVAARRYALRRNLPFVTSYHTDFPQYTRDYGFPFLAPLVWRWLVRFHGPARQIHTPGVAVRDELVRRGLRNAVVWGRGVDTAHFHPSKRESGWRRWLGGGDDTVIVLHVGRLAAEKNLRVLVEAWTRAHRFLGPRAVFAIAGDGPEKQYIATNIPFTRQLGFVDRESLASLYASADLCVLPSRTETCGLVALEAMASGIPVIAADAGGLRESVLSDVNGILVRPDDARGFSQAIIALVGDATRRHALGKGARQTAEGRDVKAEDLELLRLYGALLGGVADPRSSPYVASLETEGALTRC